MASNKKYWKNVEELDANNPVVETLRQNEFVEEIPVDDFLGDKETLEDSSTTRRDFLKYVGFSTAAATLAACEGPVNKSIPYVVQPTEIIPGVPNYYATAIADGYDFANILIKTREGRPIKVENNTDAKHNNHANARVHASVLSMYDNTRVQGPKTVGEYISWDRLDREVGTKLTALQSAGKEVVLLTQTFASPTTSKLISAFKQQYSNVRHVVYDAISCSAALDAFEAKYGTRGMADYDFAKAELIVSIGADFLADWQGGGFDGSYAKGRIPKGEHGHAKMSRHIQFESNMTLSGANADKRISLTPSQQKVALATLYGELNGTSIAGSLPENVKAAIKDAAKEIKKAGSKAVVVTGVNDVDAQSLVLEVNEKLASEAFITDMPILTRQGSDKAIKQFLSDIASGKVGGVIMAGVNPGYTLPNATEFVEKLAGLDLSVAFTMKEDETALASQYIAATPHYLESWGDVEMKKGMYSLVQPTIRPLFDTRQFQDALLKWMGNDSSYYEYLKENWESSILNGEKWVKAAQDGFFYGEGSTAATTPEAAPAEDVVEEETATTDEAPASDASSAAQKLARASSSGIELTLYPKIGMGDGQQSSNPWLQEFPDPISRITWDNYLTVSEADAKEWGLYLDRSNFFVTRRNSADGGLNGKYATITVNGTSVTAPVIVQPGQAQGTVGLSFGYGKKAGMKAVMQTGVNAYPLYKDFNDVHTVDIAEASDVHEFAAIQLQNTLMGRGDIVKETTLEIFNTRKRNQYGDFVFNEKPHVSKDHEMISASSPEADLWDSFDRSIGHHFNLSIDLNACTGCGACVIACHAENNVPVVGKEEIRKSRDMHWLRIDRYYSSEATFGQDDQFKDEISGLTGETGSLQGFGRLEDSAANPQVVFQPIMCQHCNHAPCETVCPVAATSHGRQGQNHMAYNRCVGTRYCANNCPYKVRRFNWFLYNNNDEFDYNMNNDLGRMVLNPDVVVRSRGVMEKCSMCIQKTQRTILDAKREGRPVKDGEFQTACSEACGSGAMVFGDINDSESEITKLKDDDRAYHLLEHVGTQPNVVYQVKVRNTKEA